MPRPGCEPQRSYVVRESRTRVPPTAGWVVQVRSLAARLASLIYVRDSCLGDEPLARTNYLMLGRIVVAPRRAVSLGPTSSTHGHPPVRLWHMVVVELLSNV